MQIPSMRRKRKGLFRIQWFTFDGRLNEKQWTTCPVCCYDLLVNKLPDAGDFIDVRI